MVNFTSPIVQASRLIRHIGDTVSASGESIDELPPIAEIIGAPSEESACDIALQLYEAGLINTQGEPTTFYGGEIKFYGVNLTLEGWARYEAQRQQSVGRNLGNSARTHKYDVTLSFAGEDREYASKLAARLREAGFSVFYDEDESADLWGKNLQEHFAKVYKDDARFCVMFLSEHYASKPWPKHERRSALARSLGESHEYILPVRLDDTEVPGILPTIAHLDVSAMNVDDAVSKIFDGLLTKLTSTAAGNDESSITSKRIQHGRSELELPPLERAKRYLRDPDAWAPLVRSDGCNGDFYHKQFPEFTLRVADAEDHMARHEEWTRGEVRTDNNHAGYYDLYYHETLLRRTRYVSFDDHKKSMVAPKWVPCGSGESCKSGRFYFYEADSVDYALQGFYASQEREDHSSTLANRFDGQTGKEARERWGHYLKIPVLMPEELEAFLDSMGDCDATNPCTDEDEQNQLFLRNLLAFDDWRKQIEKPDENLTALQKLFRFLSALRHGEVIDDKETFLLAVEGSPQLASYVASRSTMRISLTREGEQFLDGYNPTLARNLCDQNPHGELARIIQSLVSRNSMD